MRIVCSARQPTVRPLRRSMRRWCNRGAVNGRATHSARRRRGAATLDYILVLGVIFPLVLVTLPVGRRIIQLVYEMTAMLVSWPFM